MKNVMIIILLTAMFIAFILIGLNSSIATKSFNDREKLSSFECGFSPLFFSRAPFSLQFFLIAVIFLIFDVEITLLMPIPLITKVTSELTLILITSIFLSILILGLFYEWTNGALFWPK